MHVGWRGACACDAGTWPGPATRLYTALYYYLNPCSSQERACGSATQLQHVFLCLTLHVRVCTGSLENPFAGQERVFPAVDRLMHNGQPIGTAVRIAAGPSQPYALVLVARHCVVEGTQILRGLSAFGGQLTFGAAFPGLGVAAFKGPAGVSPTRPTHVGLWAQALSKHRPRHARDIAGAARCANLCLMRCGWCGHCLRHVQHLLSRSVSHCAPNKQNPPCGSPLPQRRAGPTTVLTPA